jgi:peroxiredoxin
MPNGQPRRRWIDRTVVTTLLIALGLVVLLGRSQQSLRAEISKLRERASFLHPGYFVPAFEAQALDGEALLVGGPPPGGGQVLLVLSTTCPHCEATLPAWSRIALALRKDTGVRVIGLSLDGLDSTVAYVTRHGIEYPVVVLADERLRFLYRTRTTPQTLVVNDQGRVRLIRRGRIESTAVVDSVVLVARHANE